MEVLFNYLGSKGSLAQDNRILRPATDFTHSMRIPQSDCPRMALFEINAFLQDGELDFTLAWCKNVQRQPQILAWVEQLERCLVSLSRTLPRLERSVTISDFPLLPLTPERLAAMVQATKKQTGLETPIIEAAYPCTAVQEGILLSQIKDESHYGIEFEWKMTSRHPTKNLAAEKMAEAWTQIVQRHTILRTVFVPSSRTGSVYDQVVVRNLDARISTAAPTDPDANAHTRTTLTPPGPLHLLTLSPLGPTEIVCKLQISHALMDGSSMSTILGELVGVYADTAAPTSGEITLQFGDYVQYLQDHSSSSSIDFWKAHLSDVTPSHVPLNATETSHSEHELCTVDVGIGAESSKALLSFCKEQSVTPATVLKAAWSLVLRTFTGSDDVCFGYLASGRDAPLTGIDNAIGPYISMLVSRTAFGSETSLAEVAGAIQRHSLDASQHRNVSLAAIQHALGLAERAMFNTVMSIQRRDAGGSEVTGELLVESLTRNDPTEYACVVNLSMDAETGILADISYWSHEISHETAKSLAESFETAISLIVEHPGQKVKDVSLCSRSSLEKMRGWNRIFPSLSNACVHEKFVQQAAERPAAQAIVGPDASLSYMQLDTLSTNLAAYLQGLGVRPESLVPLCFEKSAVAIVCMLGVLKAGGGFVALDPSHPISRTETIVKSTGANIMLTSTKSQLAPILCKNIISIDLELLQSLPPLQLDPLRRPDPSNVAAVIFTSGSTGTPKGVLLEHGGLCTSMDAHGSLLGIGPQTRTLQFAAYVFDISLHDIFTTLRRGGCVCVPSEHERFNGLDVAINRMEANWACLTPTVASSLAARPHVSSLKGIVLAGEAMNRSCLEAWNGRVSLFNFYGPCEASIFATGKCALDPSTPTDEIGRPIQGNAWIVDPNNHALPMPIGSVGELLLQGPLLARGYLDDADKTNASFVEPPAFCQSTTFSRHRCYKTGDLAWFDAAGSLHYVGRKDAQVKIHGQRVELSEIEHHLRKAIPRNVDVVAEQITVQGTKTLVAFLCENGEDGQGSACLLPGLGALESVVSRAIASLEENIMAYMIPRAFLPVSKVPKTTSGKTNRRALRALTSSLDARALRAYSAAPDGLADSTSRTRPSANMLRELIAATLDADSSEMSTNSNFFRLGGDSISAIKLAAEARDCGLALTVADIFQHPTIGGMADVVEGAGSSRVEEEYTAFSLFDSQSVSGIMAGVADDYGLDANCIEDVLPCTPLQEGLMALSLKNGAYIARHVFAVPEGTDLLRFKNAWERAFEAHAILRTRICNTENHGIVQVVVRGEINWQSLPALKTTSAAPANLPMTLGTPLAHIELVGPEQRPSHFALTLHHAIYDGWSLPLILEYAKAAYESPITRPGSENELAQPQVSFGSFIQCIAHMDKEAASVYWTSQLNLAQVPQFPACGVKTPSPPPLVDAAIERELKIESEAMIHITVPNLIRAAWALLVASHCGTPHALFGETLTGRNAAVHGIDRLAAPTITTVPIAVPIDLDQSTQQFLSAIQSMYVRMIPHEHLGLSEISGLSNPARVACQFDNLLLIQVDRDGPAWEPHHSEASAQGFLTYSLVSECMVRENSVLLRTSFDSSRLSRDDVEAIGRQFEGIFHQLCARDLPLRDVLCIKDDDARLGAAVTIRSDAPSPGHYGLEGPIGSTPATDETLAAEPAQTGMLTTRALSLALLWGKILKVDPDHLDLDSHFFRLGGDSIAAMRLVGAARKCGLELSVAGIFKFPTLGAMHEELGKSSPRFAIPYVEFLTAPEVSVQEFVEKMDYRRKHPTAAVEDVMPATDYQDWALSCGFTRNRGYNNYFIFSFEAQIDPIAVQSACQRLSDRHPILRTSFGMWQGRTYQAVWEPLPIDFCRHDECDEHSDAVGSVIRNDLGQDVRLGEMVTRFFFVRQHKKGDALVIRLSHAQYDGISLPGLLRDLRSLYEGIPLSPVVPFSAFITHVYHTAKEPAETYWKGMLRDSTMTQVVAHRTPSIANAINQTITRDIRMPPLEAGITFATALQVCWGLTLARLAGSDDVVFGRVSSGRSTAIPDVDSIAGPCLNIVPVRIRLGEKKVDSLLREVQDQTIASIPYETMGLRHVVDRCTSWPKWTRFSSVVQHQNLDEAIDGDTVFGATKCRIGCHLPPNDAADIWVWTFPGPDDSVKVEITFSDCTVGPKVAATMLDILCHFIDSIGKQKQHYGEPTVPEELGGVVLPIEITKSKDNGGGSRGPGIVSEAAVDLVAMAWSSVVRKHADKSQTESLRDTDDDDEGSGLTESSSSSVDETLRELSSSTPSALPGHSTDYLSSNTPSQTDSSCPLPLSSEPTSCTLDLMAARGAPEQKVTVRHSAADAPCSDKKHATPPTVEELLEERLRLYGLDIAADVPFYEISGVRMVAPQLVAAYRECGANLDVEDVVARSTMAEQALFLGELLNLG